MINKKLTLKDARRIRDKYWKKVTDKQSREFHLLHSESISTTIILLAKDRHVDINILKIAALVHDIGYSVRKETHPLHSVEILEKEGYILSDKLKDCILNHSTGSSPKTVEGKLFQTADKADIFNPVIISVIAKYNKKNIKDGDLKFLESVSAKAIGLLKEYNLG